MLTLRHSPAGQEALVATWIEYIHSVCIAQLIAVHEDLTKKTKNSTRSNASKRKGDKLKGNASDDEADAKAGRCCELLRFALLHMRKSGTQFSLNRFHCFAIVAEAEERATAKWQLMLDRDLYRWLHAFTYHSIEQVKRMWCKLSSPSFLSVFCCRCDTFPFVSYLLLPKILSFN